MTDYGSTVARSEYHFPVVVHTFILRIDVDGERHTTRITHEKGYQPTTDNEDDNNDNSAQGVNRLWRAWIECFCVADASQQRHQSQQLLETGRRDNVRTAFCSSNKYNHFLFFYIPFDSLPRSPFCVVVAASSFT